MSETPKFSLLGSMRNQQNAQAKPPEKPATQQPIQQSTQQSAPPAGNLLTRKSLLGGSTSTPQKPTEPVGDKETHADVPAAPSLLDSARVSKGGLLGSLEKAKANQEVVKAEHDKLFMEPPKDFRELLDSFDKFFAGDTGISEFNLAPARDFVERIFIDLRTDPSLDGLMLDKDVANVIEWVSKVKGEALAAGVEKKEKAAKKAAQPKAKNRFGDLGTIDLTVMPKSLQDMSDFGDI